MPEVVSTAEAPYRLGVVDHLASPKPLAISEKGMERRERPQTPSVLKSTVLGSYFANLLARTQSLPNVNFTTSKSSAIANDTTVSGSNKPENREKFLLQACLKLAEEMTDATGKQKNVSNTIKIGLLKLRKRLEELKIRTEKPCETTKHKVG